MRYGVGSVDWVTRLVYGAVLLALLVVSGCGPLGGDEGDQTDGIPPAPPQVIAGEWTLNQPSPYVVEPGMQYELVVKGVNVDPDEVVIWIEGDIALYPFAMRVIEDGGDDTTSADDTLAFDHYVPFVTTGSHYVALGTLDRRFTGEALLHVVVPQRRLSQRQVAEVMAQGMRRELSSIRQRTIDSDDLSTKALVEGYLGAQGVSAFRRIIDGSEQIADSFADDYMALDSNQEAALQSVLYHTGVLHMAEPRLDEIYGTRTPGSTSQALKVTGPFDSMRHPVHQAFFELDMTSMIAGVTGEALGFAEIIFAISGVGAPVSAALTVVNVVNAVIQVLVDNFMPTDLVAIEAHDQRSLYDSEPTGWVYWGTFQAENGSGDPLSLDTIIAEIIGAAIPGGKGVKQISRFRELRRLAAEGFTAAFGTIMARAGVSIADQLKLLEATPPVPVKMAMNMQAYSTKLSDVLEKIPPLKPLADSLKKLIDLEFSSSVELDLSAAPAWASGAEIDFDYEKDTISLSGVGWPAGTGELDVTLKAHAFRYVTRSFGWGFFRRPGWEEVDYTHQPVTLKQAPDPMDFNADNRDQDFIVLNVFDPQNLGTGEVAASEYVDTFSERQRMLLVTFTDLLAQASDTASIMVMVDGVPQYSNVVFGPKSHSLPLTLHAGRNTITVVALTEHQATLTYGKHLKVGIEVPAQTGHTLDQFYMDAGETHSFHVWMPPQAN